jgi:hypothetical protein
MHLVKSTTPAVRKSRIITLTNCAPIRIIEDEWPVVAQGECDCNYGIECAPWRFKISFHVRVYHEDMDQWNRRAIIYASYQYGDDDKQEHQHVRVGRQLNPVSPGELWERMVEVAEELRTRIDREDMRRQVTHALDNCFANLEPLKR